MRRALLVCSLVVLTACKRRPPPPTPEPPPSSSVAAIERVASPPPAASPSTSAPGSAPSASASARVDAGACTPLDWQDDGLAASDATFVGTLWPSEAPNAAEEIEKFYYLSLSRPVCTADGTPVDQVEVYEDDESVHLKPFRGKRVKVVGVSFARTTSHHHRDIVVGAAKIARAP